MTTISDSLYLLGDAADDEESVRLAHLEAFGDPLTVRHLSATGVTAGWRCVKVAAGRGSVARWMVGRVGPSGAVVATDLNPRFLGDVADAVEVRQHDVLNDPLEPGAYDLVHCRSLLQHLADPQLALERMVSALAPGGWLVVEEADFGLWRFAGHPEAERATAVWFALAPKLAVAQIADPWMGRQLPELVADAGLGSVGVEVTTPVCRPGDHAYELLRLACPSLARAAAAVGIPDDDFKCFRRVFDEGSTPLVALTMVAAWGRKES